MGQLQEIICSWFCKKEETMDKENVGVVKSLTKLVKPVPAEVKVGLAFGIEYPPDIAALTGIKYHKGVDFLAVTDTPCFATKGEIVNVYNDQKWFGLYVVNKVVLDTGEILYCYYCHLNKALVNIGDKVDSGQTIAYTDASGSATRLENGEMIEHPHLHFEVRKGSRDSNAVIDPLPYIEEA